MSGSNLHQAVTALTAAFQSAAIDGLSVTDGPNWDPEIECLEVGWAGDDREAVEVVRSHPTNAAGVGAEEQLLIWCRLSCWDGNKTVPQAREALSGIFAQLVGVIEAGVTLGDTVGMAWVGEIRYSPRRFEGGAEATVDFPVSATAFA